MLKKTKGIVISSLRYKETSIIAKIFTRELGLKSYLVNGVRSSGGKSKIALYQPLTILDLVVYDKENSGLQRISEAKLAYVNQLIPFDFKRTGLAMFMAEITGRTIYDNYQNEWLYDFIQDCILRLDRPDCPIVSFPLIFLIEHARFLGFGPDDPEHYLTESKSLPFAKEEIPIALEYLKSLMSESYESKLKPSLSIRRKLLDYLLEFYREQLDTQSPWKSISVLRQLMS
ncbi:DNA repair protein RecO [Algoriphagus sp. CAU 1675]|uniref:DNA repair protein RecO n=1 Tax=Algoriphagus sp. CAU 1675 TaxID=3032597 RepID=UPI0023D9D5B5|nr:DNA repair protein RecO [Algoriphagus sp. CAU 1675]MDF2158935.1 DNA repair protein RecO [Algoriphagus sp. CAU 1675]